MRQIALKNKVSALLGKGQVHSTTHAFDQWSQISWWRRLFLPADFVSHVVLCQEENLEYRKSVTQFLSVKERRRFTTARVGELQKYRRDLDYHPPEFKNQRITFIEAEEKVQCDRCRGKGRIDCSAEVPCPNCKGRRTRNEFCFSCKGSGRMGRDEKEQCWACRGRGVRSEGCAACADVYSGSTGKVKCSRCGGVGWVVCRSCAGAGEKVRANLVTRTYTRSSESHFRSGRLERDEFRFGLVPRHFRSLRGDLVHQEYQTPSNATIVLQQHSVYSYAVNSMAYRYKGLELYLNRIYSRAGSRFVASNLPWSKPKLASAGVLSVITIFGLAALLLAA